jgi:3-dehydroquinate synthase class II
MLKVASSDVERILRKALGSFRLDRVKIEEGFDHDGEAAVFVTAFLQPHSPPMPGDVSGSANVVIAQMLKDAGDERLSYLYIRRPDDERPADEEAAASSS